MTINPPWNLHAMCHDPRVPCDLPRLCIVSQPRMTASVELRSDFFLFFNRSKCVVVDVRVKVRQLCIY